MISLFKATEEVSINLKTEVIAILIQHSFALRILERGGIFSILSAGSLG